MNVLVSTDGSTSVDSYGIFSDSANITNGVNGSVVFRKRGTGIATTSGRVINMGSIKLEQGGTGISSANGDVYNAENAQIVIDDNNTASSTGIVAQAGKITNDGTISITNGNGATGIKAGLLVNNNKLITLTGRNITGIELTGQDAIANNYDDISITSNGISENNFGIKAGASAVNATITNNNDIKLTGSSSYSSTQQKGYGISIVDGTAENKGSITFDGMYGWGMYTTTGTVKNSTGSIIMNAGGTGLYGNGSGAQMINSQKIAINVPDNDDKAETYGIYADGGASASNTANAEIYIKSSSVTANMLAKAFGIYVNQGSGTNQGTIKIEGSNTVGMAYAGSTDTDAIINLESGLINLTGNNHIGMTAAGGVATNRGTINVGVKTDDGTITASPYSVGMQTTGGIVLNQGTVNVNSANSVGLQSDDANGVITNNGTIYIDDTALNSYAFLSKAGSAVNGTTGIVINNQSNTDYMRAEGGEIRNNGTLTINNSVSNVNAMHVAEGGSALNYGDEQSGVYGTINVGTSSSATGTNNVGMLVDGDEAGSATNEGVINVYSKDSYGMKVDNENGSLINNGTINIMAGATGSVAMYGEKGTISNGKKGVINMGVSGTVMKAADATISNEGTITLANTASTAMRITNNGTAQNAASGTINVNGSNSYALAADDGATATLNNAGTININNGATGSYAMYGKNATLTNETSGTINVLQSGKAENAYGMYGSNMTNAGTISITGTGTGASYGMRSTGGTVSNTGQIEVTASQGYGISLTGSGTATNLGTITVTGTGSDTSYGMYGSGGAKLINNGTINVNSTSGTAVGMYATGSGSSITNTGNIVLNGVSITTDYSGIFSSDDPDTDATNCTSAGCGNFIKVENGATFHNNGQVSSASAINFNVMSAANTGTIMLARGGSFEAPEISGEITAAADIVTEGNETTYVNENSFVGQDSGIKLNSGSYLFDAYLVTNEAGNQDVVMTMKNFADVVDNGSVANFLSSNYTLGKNMDMYSILKAAGDATSFTTAVAEQMGLNLIPSFAKQNMDIVKAVNRHMSQTLFANQSSNDVRAMFDFVYDYREQDGVNMLSGYEDNAATAYALFDRKYNNNFRYGLGVSFTRYESDYDNGSSRDEVVAQVLAPLIYTTEGLKAVSMPRLGIGWGEYKRRIGSDESKADVKNYYYGITNEVRKEIDLGTVTLEPTAEFNILGLYQDSTKEKNGLEVKSANNLSVEGGIGLYARKSFSIMEENDLTLRAGGSWYHEFNNPYQAARARIAGMLGSYQMDTYDVERDRGILSVRMDYKHDRFDFYFEANKFLEEDDGYALSAGLGYKF